MSARIYPRDAARALGISEAEYLTRPQPGQSVRRLRPDWLGLFAAFQTLGPVMVLTRNDHCVHEKIGRFETVDFSGMAGLVLGADIDLRVFHKGWAFAFAVEQTLPDGGRRDSLQFYQRSGDAVFKLYRRDDTDGATWEALLGHFAAPELDNQPITVDASTPAEAPQPDSTIAVADFRAEWDGLQDTHDFHGLLRRFKLARTQALRLGGVERARPVMADAIRPLLTAAADAQTGIMVFVGNPGMIQIHSGPVTTLLERDGWLNVLDPGFNLHLKLAGIDSAWVVRKPTVDGDVTSLELYDAAGNNIAMLFGVRKPGQAEDPAWRSLVNGLPDRTPQPQDAAA